jgi:tRNA-2-methylthio-N6-dimethylallyladenosine synthase
LTIQEGCDKFCSFCVVPYTRGAEISRPAGQVLEEAGKLVKSGLKEITLLGQNVNAYHGVSSDGKEWTLGRLIRELAELDGLERIRYTTSHPKDMDDDLISAHGEVPKLMPYLHLPVQSGSNTILKNMNRKHNITFYRSIIDKLRKAREDIAFSSDFIVGFPGETDADFAETLRLVSDIEFAQAYSFKYSSRPGTPASDKVEVGEQIKSDRLESLQQLLNAQQLAFNLKKVGTVQSVLVEKQGRKQGQLVGKTPYMQAAHFCGSEQLIGSIQKVRILDGFSKGISGDMVDNDKVYDIQEPTKIESKGIYS